MHSRLNQSVALNNTIPALLDSIENLIISSDPSLDTHYSLQKPSFSAIAIAIVDRKVSAYPGVQKSLTVLVKNGILSAIKINYFFRLISRGCKSNYRLYYISFFSIFVSSVYIMHPFYTKTVSLIMSSEDWESILDFVGLRASSYLLYSL